MEGRQILERRGPSHEHMQVGTVSLESQKSEEMGALER